ncbi:MAG TPA: ABC transporter substrate-binding protein [Actinopolymorphaceae bacterium]|jgi:ABC-type transport system substrate-binding protein
MQVPARKAAVASVAALALILGACGGNQDNEGGNGGDGQASTGGSTFSVYIGEPEHPLIPGMTNETEGGQVVDALWTGLIEYDAETNEPEFTGVAQSIESDDQKTWTVKLKDGWTFHDGTPVTAQSFVDAWNWNAYGPNGAANSYFFSNIEGYDEMQGKVEFDDQGNVTKVVEEPKADKLAGLEVVDDLTFTVTLKEPFSIFPLTLGYTAFFPLPKVFFEDPKAFGKQPVGNGPWMANEPFQPGVGITLDRYDDYAGEEKAKAEHVEIKVYADANTGYTDVQAGTLDINDTLPTSALKTGPDEFGDRWVESPNGSITTLAFPLYDKRYQDKRVRQAFSMAIDRDLITKEVFLGSRLPAHSFASPVAAGYKENACAETTKFDPERANQLLDEAGFDRSKPITLWFNSGAGHEEWVEAVANQLKQNLGIADYKLESLDFAQFLPLRDNKGMTGPYRAGWIMDYPHIQNFLEPIYSEAALAPTGSNDTRFVNKEFDALLKEAGSASSPEEAAAKYQEAEQILCEEMPGTPLFYGRNQLVHTERVDNVFQDGYGRIDLARVTVKE